MNVRTLATAAVAVALVAGDAGFALAAKAKPKPPPPVCQQIKDDTGDSFFLSPTNPAAQPTSDAYDIVSADIATGKRNLVAAIRLKTLERDEYSSLGVTYIIEWDAGGTTHQLAYREYMDGTAPNAKFLSDKTGNAIYAPTVPVAVNPSTSTITFTVPRKMDPALKKAGATLTNFKVSAGIGNNRSNSHGQSPFDYAESTKKYKDGTATCLKGT
jgi:hypothetical protein